MTEPRLVVSGFPNLMQADARTGMMTWAQVTGMLSKPRTPPPGGKRMVPAWAPARFAPTRRRNGNVQEVSCLVLDYDSGIGLDEAMDQWAGWERCAHTTWSHDVARPKLRLVLPLARPITRRLHGALYRAALDRSPGADVACKDAARAWLMPATERPSLFDFRSAPGAAWLDADELIPAATLRPVRQRSTLSQPWHLPASLAKRYLEVVGQQVQDPAERARIADVVGAELNSEVARKAPCPNCCRYSVWWPLEPHDFWYAMCDHRRSCGWVGSLTELLGIATEAEELTL